MTTRNESCRSMAVRAASAWLILVAMSIGCSSKDDVAPAPADDGGLDNGTIGPGCSTPETGCDCREIGKEITCIVTRVSGGYVSCPPGTRTCLPTGKWGICDGAATVWDGAVPNETGTEDAADASSTDTGSTVDTGSVGDTTSPKDTTPAGDDVGGGG